MCPKISCLCGVVALSETREFIPVFHHVKKKSMALKLRVSLLMLVKKLWRIWKCSPRDLIDILTGRWKLLKNGL